MRINAVKRNYQEIQQQEKDDYNDNLGVSDMESEGIETRTKKLKKGTGKQSKTPEKLSTKKAQ